MQRLSFLTSKSFWVIALCVTALHGLVFWSLKDTVIFERVAYMFKEVLPRTFLVSRYGTEETAGDNGVLLPGEVVYTVPSEVEAIPAEAPDSPPPVTDSEPSNALIPTP